MEGGGHGSAVAALHGDDPGQFSQLPEADISAEQHGAIAGRHENIIGNVDLVLDLVGERFCPFEKQGIIDMGGIVGRFRRLQDRPGGIVAAARHFDEVGLVGRDLLDFAGGGAFRQIDVATDPGGRAVAGDRRAGVARGIFDHLADAQFPELVDQDERAAILERAGRLQIIQLQVYVGVAQFPPQHRRRDFAQRHPGVDGFPGRLFQLKQTAALALIVQAVQRILPAAVRAGKVHTNPSFPLCLVCFYHTTSRWPA